MCGSGSPKVVVSATRPACYNMMAPKMGVQNWGAPEFQGLLEMTVWSCQVVHRGRACECRFRARRWCLEEPGDEMTTTVLVLLADRNGRQLSFFRLYHATQHRHGSAPCFLSGLEYDHDHLFSRSLIYLHQADDRPVACRAVPVQHP